MKLLPLKGLDILVVEDHYFIATELSGVLQGLGAAVIGPVSRLPLDRSIACRRIDVALLDVQLTVGTSLSLADELACRGIPVAFITGYGSDVLPLPYRDLLRLDKPVDRDQLAIAVLRLAGRMQGVAA